MHFLEKTFGRQSYAAWFKGPGGAMVSHFLEKKFTASSRLSLQKSGKKKRRALSSSSQENSEKEAIK